MIATEKKKKEVSSVYRCHLLPELRRVRLFELTLALSWQVMCSSNSCSEQLEVDIILKVFLLR